MVILDTADEYAVQYIPQFDGLMGAGKGDKCNRNIFALAVYHLVVHTFHWWLEILHSTYATAATTPTAGTDGIW